LPYTSQTTLVKENRVKAIVDEKGDTLITLHYEDATNILIDLLICEETEKELITKDTLINLLQLTSIFKDSIIYKQEERYTNCVEANINYLSVIDNKNKIIDNLQRQVRKEKRNKIIAIISGGLLTLLAILVF
jgi:hypothetical protein